MIYLLLALANFIFIPHNLFKMLVSLLLIILIESKRRNGNATGIMIAAEFLAALMLFLILGGYVILFIIKYF